MDQLYRFSTEQEELRAALRRLLEESTDPLTCYRDPEGTERLDAALAAWGLAGLGVPEELGGCGGGVLEQVVAAEEIGRAVAPVHLVATASATAVLAALPLGADLLAQVCAGRRSATVAYGDRPGSGQVGRFAASAQDGRWRVDGTAGLLFAPGRASVVLAPASTPEGPALFALTDVALQQHEQIDHSRALGTVRCAGAAATRLTAAGEAGSVAPVLDLGLRRARLLLAAESVGLAAAVLERTAGYTTQREQFGQPIGTFQAVKHRLADLLVAVENARSAVYAAAWAERDGAAGAEMLTSMAKAVATEAGTFAAASGVQLHGGIAITWEHPMHAFLRRAKSNEALLGKASWHLERIAAQLLDRPGT